MPEFGPIVVWAMFEFVAVGTYMWWHFAFEVLDESHNSLAVVAAAAAVANRKMKQTKLCTFFTKLQMNFNDKFNSPTLVDFVDSFE